jgi:hypothetical protein
MADKQLEELLAIRYDGELVNGRMESEEPAEYVFSTGTVYRGPFKNGCFHGQGELWAEGRKCLVRWC